MGESTCDTILFDDFLCNMEGVEVDFGFSCGFSLVLDDDFSGINGLNNSGCDTTGQ